MAYTIVIGAEYDDLPVRGNAMATDDAEADRACEDEILARLDRGDVWAWAYVTVTAVCEGCEAEGTDSLGACSYANAREFKADAYYTDMAHAAMADCDAKCICDKST
jgi:hypothetical protein